ncbi:hypothetical protein, partial [Streptomyces sp. NPDC001270]|uniref:hypothetical protein n=1 Tax=Streptomyces sp. NPDC001270 TaxID=3364554 RepID=UPI003694115C
MRGSCGATTVPRTGGATNTGRKQTGDEIRAGYDHAWEAPHMNRTPAEDRVHWERTADRLLLAVRRYGSEDHALVQLPGVPS